MNYIKYIGLFCCCMITMVLFAQEENCGVRIYKNELKFIQAYEEKHKQDDHQQIMRQKSASANYVLTIKPHILQRSNGEGGLSFEEVIESVKQANHYFSSQVGIRFVLCTPNYIKDDRLFSSEMKRDTHYTEEMIINEHVEHLINVYFAPITEWGGWATKPTEEKYTNNRAIFVENGSALNGTTLAHEIGHYLNLLHTHEHTYKMFDDSLEHNPNLVEPVNGWVSTRQRTGDFLADTPADPKLSGSNVDKDCNYIGTEVDQNNTPYHPLTNNIMSYSPKKCRNKFTAGQVDRMINNLLLDAKHREIINACPCGGMIPVLHPEDPQDCVDDLRMSFNTNSAIKVFTSKNSIQNIGENQIYGSADIVYQAGESIILSGGFKVALGAKFKADIKPCSEECQTRSDDIKSIGDLYPRSK